MAPSKANMGFSLDVANLSAFVDSQTETARATRAAGLSVTRLDDIPLNRLQLSTSGDWFVSWASSTHCRKSWIPASLQQHTAQICAVTTYRPSPPPLFADPSARPSWAPCRAINVRKSNLTSQSNSSNQRGHPTSSWICAQEPFAQFQN